MDPPDESFTSPFTEAVPCANAFAGATSASTARIPNNFLTMTLEPSPSRAHVAPQPVNVRAAKRDRKHRVGAAERLGCRKDLSGG
jgi:hypothetical protein